MNLNANLAAEAESLYRTATRLQRVGLIIDRTALSPDQRRAAFALQCLTANCPAEEEPPADACPPADGPISGVVQQISDGIRNGGGAPLADVIDQVNCQLVVGVLGL